MQKKAFGSLAKQIWLQRKTRSYNALVNRLFFVASNDEMRDLLFFVH